MKEKRKIGFGKTKVGGDTEYCLEILKQKFVIYSIIMMGVAVVLSIILRVFFSFTVFQSVITLLLCGILLILGIINASMLFNVSYSIAKHMEDEREKTSLG